MHTETSTLALSQEEPVSPPGFEPNPESMDDDDVQIRNAWKRYNYQNAPFPSFENTPTVDITPTFNPTGAPESEIYARGRAPKSLREKNTKPKSEWPGGDEPVTMWRIVERSRVEDGTGLTSSAIMQNGSLGDVEHFDDKQHYASWQHKRDTHEGSATPFLSFSTDPEYLARDLILKRGFGVKGGRDSVIVQVRVDPDRVLTGNLRKAEEVVLLGGVAPQEFMAAYSVADFIAAVVPEGSEVETTNGGMMDRDRALGSWLLQIRPDIWSDPGVTSVKK